MSPADVWLNENADIGEKVVELFRDDRRLAGLALPDAVLLEPELLADMAKEVVCEAVRREAPAEVAEELFGSVRRMARGARSLSPYVRDVLRSLKGSRDSTEIEPLLLTALENVPPGDRAAVEGMLDTIRRSAAGSFGDEPIVVEPESFSGVHCVACCVLGCTVLPKVCPVACVVGCVTCGSV